jgi:hypothetical protein
MARKPPNEKTEEAPVELPSAKAILKQIALKEAEKAAEHMRQRAAAETEKKELVERLSKPYDLSEQEAIKRATAIIQRAANNGLTEVQIMRFPNKLCTDRGRAINNQEPGWENTLTGRPKELYAFWSTHLRSKGYKFRCQIVDFPDGMPGDVGITLSWG